MSEREIDSGNDEARGTLASNASRAVGRRRRALGTFAAVLVAACGGCSSGDAKLASDVRDTGDGDAGGASNDAARDPAPKVDETAAEPSSPGPCAEGTWDHDGSPATACVAWSTCAPGTYAVSAPSATADRMCAAWSNCPAGTYVSAPGSATADQTCASCATATFSTTPNAASCTAATICTSPTHFVSSAGTSTSDRVCAPCAASTESSVDNDTACDAAAVRFTAGTLDGDSNDSTGYRFRVGPNAITVRALGVYDEDQNGLAEAHPVGIYDYATKVLLASATVPAGTAATLTGDFRYAPITPVVLNANAQYVIQSYRATSADRITYNVTNQTVTAGITFEMTMFQNASNGLVFPTLTLPTKTPGIYAPGFKFF